MRTRKLSRRSYRSAPWIATRPPTGHRLSSGCPAVAAARVTTTRRVGCLDSSSSLVGVSFVDGCNCAGYLHYSVIEMLETNSALHQRIGLLTSLNKINFVVVFQCCVAMYFLNYINIVHLHRLSILINLKLRKTVVAQCRPSSLNYL